MHQDLLVARFIRRMHDAGTLEAVLLIPVHGLQAGFGGLAVADPAEQGAAGQQQGGGHRLAPAAHGGRAIPRFPGNGVVAVSMADQFLDGAQLAGRGLEHRITLDGLQDAGAVLVVQLAVDEGIQLLFRNGVFAFHFTLLRCGLDAQGAPSAVSNASLSARRARHRRLMTVPMGTSRISATSM